MVEVIKINKKLAASSQIDTAITLFNDKNDVISILSLSYSAWGIIKNMLKAEHKSVRQALADYQIENNQAKTDQEAWVKIDEIWSFIKHAKNDPGDSYQFKSGLEEIVLFSVIHDYIQLYGDCSESMKKYYHRWIENNKNVILSDCNLAELTSYLKTLDDPDPRLRGGGGEST